MVDGGRHETGGDETVAEGGVFGQIWRQINHLAGFDVLAQRPAAPGGKHARRLAGAEGDLQFGFVGVVQDMGLLGLETGVGGFKARAGVVDQFCGGGVGLQVPFGNDLIGCHGAGRGCQGGNTKQRGQRTGSGFLHLFLR
ncbi:hypothetical protein GCM10010970_18990 [Silvimonas iriomotensis]|uniref:Uncharacterized protein n=1 Tax=Silvimonas iriomotensis TaxID=449662 RepID=A0ABQ2P9J9_9NEIS|nr:hypothetical protein GCM10010970_18990 [Silvimonas iriomotensis]